jgi:hypothetical protein
MKALVKRRNVVGLNMEDERRDMAQIHLSGLLSFSPQPTFPSYLDGRTEQNISKKLPEWTTAYSRLI